MIHRRVLYHCLALSWVTRALAHDLEVSKSEIIVEGARVNVHVEVAERELANRSTLKSFLETRTDVMLGSERCAPSVTEPTPVDRDGLAIDAIYTCSKPSDELAIGLSWLGSMQPGHRHVAHLVFRETALTAVLTADHPTASLRAASPVPPAPAPRPVWPWFLGGAVALVLVIFAWRNRLESRRDEK